MHRRNSLKSTNLQHGTALCAVVLALTCTVSALNPPAATAKDKDKAPAAEVVLPPLAGPIGDPAKAKVLMALLYDKSCYAACQKARPILMEIVNEHLADVAYLEIDLSDYTAAVKLAKQHGVGALVRDSSDEVPMLGYFDEHRKSLGFQQGAKPKEKYAQKLQQCLDQVSQRKP